MAARTALPAPHPPPLAVTMKTFTVSFAAAVTAAVSFWVSAVAAMVEKPLNAATEKAMSRYFAFIARVRYPDQILIPKNII